MIIVIFHEGFAFVFYFKNNPKLSFRINAYSPK